MRKNNYTSSKKEQSTSIDTATNHHLNSQNQVSNSNTQITFNQLLLNIDSTITSVLLDITTKSQRQKLISIQDTIKKYMSSNSFSSSSSHSNINQKKNNQEIDLQKDTKKEEEQVSNVFIKRKSKTDPHSKQAFNSNEYQSSHGYDNNCTSTCILKDENIKLKEEIGKLKQTYSGMIETEDKKSNKKIENLKYSLNEERNINRELILQTQSLEDALKKLNTEYNSLSYRFAKLNNESATFERTISSLKQNLSINKLKFEEIVKINEELKSRHFSKEEFITQHNNDLKKEIKKSLVFKEKAAEFEKEIEKLVSESKVKDMRLTSLRQMNQKLEEKCSQIMKKLKNISDLQRQNDDVYESYHKKMENLDDQNKKIAILKSENEQFISNETVSRRDYEVIKEENISLKKQVIELKSINEDYQSKFDSYEGRFKNCLLSRFVSIEKEEEGGKNSKFGKSVRSNKLNSKGYGYGGSEVIKEEEGNEDGIYKESIINSNTNSNTYRNMNMNLNSNSHVNHLAIDDMKPSKLIIKDMKFDVSNNNFE